MIPSRWSGLLLCAGLILFSCVASGQQPGLVEKADRLASVLRKLDSLRTEVYFQGVNRAYTWNGQVDSLTSDSLILSKPGRYVFVAEPDSSLEVLVAYADRRDSLLNIDTLVVLFGKERTDFYCPGQAESLRTVEQFPDAMYVLADYLEPGMQQGNERDALDRLLNNPFLEKELSSWQGQETSLRRRLRAHQLQTRLNWEQQKAGPPPTSKQPTVDLSNGQVPTAPERLQKASEALYARQPGIDPFISQTAIIRGLATFVEKRAQEELNIIFLERMQRRLGNSRLGIMFPKTLGLFTQFEINDYRSLLDNAYPYFKQDLQEVGRNFPRLLRNDTALVSLRYNPDVLNAAHFLEFTNLALSGQTPDSIMRRSVEAYRTEELEMEALLRREFIAQLSDPAFAKNVLRPLKQEVDAQLERNAAFDTLLDELIAWTEPQNLAGNPGDPGRQGLVRQVEALKDHLKNEQYFLRRDQPQAYEDFNRLYAVFIQADRTALFQGAQLSNYSRFISSGKIDSIFGASLLGYTQKLVRPQAVNYVSEAFAGVQAQLDELKEVHREALELQQQTLLARGMRVLQVRTYLQVGIDEELRFWRNRSAAAIEKDTLALRFFQEVLQNNENGLRHSELEQAFFSSTLAYRQQEELEQNLDREEAFQDSLLNLLQPHLTALAEKAREPLGEQAARQTAQMAEDWNEIIRLLKQIDQERLATPIALRGLEFLDFLASVEQESLQPAAQLYRSVTDGGIGGSAENADAHNPFLAQAYTIQNIPPITLPAQLLALEEELVALRTRQQATRDDWLAVRKAWDEVYAGGQETEFYDASRNASNLRSVSELGLALLDAFRIDGQDSVITTVQDTTQLMVRTQRAGREVVQRTDTVRTQLRVKIQPRRWMRPEELDSVLADDYRRRAFLGLLYQRIASIEELPISAETTALLTTQTVELIDAIRRARIAAEQQPDSTEVDRIRQYLPVARGVLRVFSTILNTPQENTTLGQSLGLGTVASILENTLGTYEHIAQEQYGFALTSAMGLYQLFSDSEPQRKERLQARSLQSSILTYGNFMADITAARTSGQVQSILQSYSSEPGSSRLKRNSDFNVSLNAYLGPAGSYESPQGGVAGAESTWVPSLSTPVGLAINWRVARRKAKDGSIAYLPFTFFVPILDIGPVVSFNFSEGLLSSSPQLSFGDFLAPGAFVFYNIPRSPFTAGLGYQRTAEVRSVMTGSLERQDYRADRFSFFLGIDVPVFNFFTKN